MVRLGSDDFGWVWNGAERFGYEKLDCCFVIRVVKSPWSSGLLCFTPDARAHRGMARNTVEIQRTVEMGRDSSR